MEVRVPVQLTEKLLISSLGYEKKGDTRGKKKIKNSSLTKEITTTTKKQTHTHIQTEEMAQHSQTEIERSLEEK